jgi:UDP-3-O-[3-hydroxymyristoyl] glucosamine N-acyltransferase
MIYLWVTGEGWKEFELTDTAELEKRGISIGNKASIGNRARIGNGASIGDEASIGNGASIGDEASIGNRARIGDRAMIGNGARIGNGASIGDEARIGNEAKPIIIYIIGSRYPVSYWGEDRVDIGCQSRSIDAWLNDNTDIVKEYNFTVGEVEEYRGYVEFIKSVHDKNPGSTGTEDKDGRHTDQ